MDLMQRFFGFEQYIRAGAQKTIEIIRDLDIVDMTKKFMTAHCINEQDIQSISPIFLPRYKNV